MDNVKQLIGEKPHIYTTTQTHTVEIMYNRTPFIDAMNISYGKWSKMADTISAISAEIERDYDVYITRKLEKINSPGGLVPVGFVRITSTDPSHGYSKALSALQSFRDAASLEEWWEEWYHPDTEIPHDYPLPVLEENI